MVERALTTAQKSALLFEAHAARQLLGHGCHLLAGSHGIDGKFDALATSWSIGVEKMLKVTLGLAALSRGERWPNGKSFGHNLVQMNDRLLAHLTEWQESAPPSPWLAGLLSRVRHDRPRHVKMPGRYESRLCPLEPGANQSVDRKFTMEMLHASSRRLTRCRALRR